MIFDVRDRPGPTQRPSREAVYSCDGRVKESASRGDLPSVPSLRRARGNKCLGGDVTRLRRPTQGLRSTQWLPPSSPPILRPDAAELI